MDWNPTLLNTNVANSRPPAYDQPLYSNGGRVAHRTDNSDTALLEQRQKPAANRDLTLPLLVRGLSVRDRVNRPKSIYL